MFNEEKVLVAPEQFPFQVGEWEQYKLRIERFHSAFSLKVKPGKIM